MSKSIIERIQDDDPSYNPLTYALVQAKVDKDKWNAACSRVYIDGYYGPVSDEEWKEQDGREPSNVKDAIELIARVLDKIEDYREVEYCAEGETETNCTGHEVWGSYVEAKDIKAALVPFYREIYGQGYPSIGVGGNVY